MSTSTVTPPPGYTIDPSDVTVTPTGSIDPSDVTPIQPPAGYTLEPDSQPVQAGEQRNDVGAKVIVPKNGEDFAATVQRAVQLGNARQAAGTQQSVINKETATIPTKAAQTLGTAATAGIAGPAALALPGEIGGSLAAMTSAVKAVGAWANAHPVHAYLVYQALKELIPGAKKAAGIIKGTPDIP